MTRRFTPLDFEEVYDIEKKSFSDPWHRIHFAFSYWSNPAGFLVAELGEKIVGYAIVEMTRDEDPWRPKLKIRGHIQNLAVDPRFRRRGIGRKLIEAILSLLREQGVESVWLETRESNSTARAFYSKIGFKEEGRLPSYYSDEDALMMTKRL